MTARASRLATVFFFAGFAFGLMACSSQAEPAPGDDKADDPFASSRGVEVILTNPYCDVCEQADKDLLKAESPVTARVIELIDGANSTVDIAQFTFSVREIEAAIVAANDRGVAIRVAMNSTQSMGDTVATRLEAAGVDVRFVSGKQFEDRPPGLQHAKFMIVDRARLLTGSNNWSSTGTTINNENTLVFSSAETDPLIAGFACHFEAIWESQLADAGACSNDVVTFTPSTAPIGMIKTAIRGSQQSVDVLMHHLLFSDLTKELAKAGERGVRIRVVLNAADRDEVSGSAWNRLLAAGGQVRFKQTNPDLFQLMHHKLAIIDGRVLINGSGNWSGSAFFNNYENYVRYTDPRVVRPFNRLFSRLWTWSLSATALDSGQTAAQQHAGTVGTFFGNLHAHFAVSDGDRLLDDGLAERLDENGQIVAVDTGATVSEAARFAYEYARDMGEMDFMLLSPHVTEDAESDPADLPNMSVARYEELVGAAADITTESAGAFVALAGMEWNTNSFGNHVNVIGSRGLAKVERGSFQGLYEEFLPQRELSGDYPMMQLNHPRTFRRTDDETILRGSWDQIFGVNLMEIERNGERTKKFNDYGLDDYSPLADVHQSWLDGSEMPSERVVDETLATIAEVTRPYARFMEVTIGRGKELGGETAVNPSLTENPETGAIERFVKVHSDWDYYLLHGFQLAPTANHDNHRANWGTGHTSRTGVLADALSEVDLLAAMDNRSVFASEDENLELRVYADQRVPMGSELGTRADSIELSISVTDPDYSGAFAATIYFGSVGDDSVAAIHEIAALSADSLTSIDVPLPGPGKHFVYVEVHEVDVDRMAWSAPIFIHRR